MEKEILRLTEGIKLSITLAYAKEKQGGKGTDFEVRMGAEQEQRLIV